MAFRANESIRTGFEEVKNYLVSRDLDPEQRGESEEMLISIIEQYGPVVDAYPTWHPLVARQDPISSIREPGYSCGYRGLDHTRYFRNAFITCPYGNGQEVIDSVTELEYLHPWAYIEAERLDVKFYGQSVAPILVSCHWKEPQEQAYKPRNNEMIPASLALPRLLEKELNCVGSTQFAEAWEFMHREFLGSPHGKMSSLFVSQETALAMKKVWNLLINTGMYGPIKV